MTGGAADTMDTLLSLDRELKKIIAGSYLRGAHLSFMYVIAHRNHLNEMNAFRFLQDHPEAELCTDTILRVYAAMTEGTALEGKGFKEGNCYISTDDYLYIPLQADSTPAAMEELCRRYAHLNDPDPEDFDDIFRFLLDFICIHPMQNANGRLSVLIVQMLLRRAGLAMAPYIPFDMVLGRLHLAEYQRHILLASGAYYGQKPIEYDLFVPFAKGLVKEAYEIMISTCRNYTDCPRA